MTDIPKPDPKAPRCPQCSGPSVVYPGRMTMTAVMPCEFYDREGRRHVHGQNTVTTSYSCEHGHRWTEDHTPMCWCGTDKLP